MKKLLYTVMLALAVWEGASAQSPERELGALAATRSNLLNIATALQMYAADHGQYPDSLAPLEVNYLRQIPPQLNGSLQWNYKVESDGFRLNESWEGFTRLGLPAQIVYHSSTGLETLKLPSELMVLAPTMDLEGSWLRKSTSPGLSLSWERFDQKISARVLGPSSLEESFVQQKQRTAADYLRWGWSSDDGEFARAVPAALKPGWSLEGIYTVASQPGTKAILVSRGERLLEVMVQDRDSRDALGSLRAVRSLLAQL